MAQSGGIEALNVRSVALALGLPPPLIYTQVRNKEDMLARLTDEILRDRMPDLSAADPTGSAGFILSRSANRLEQPNALRVREAIFDALEEAGFDKDWQDEMLIQFPAIVLGNVVVAESLPPDERDMAMARARVEAAFGRGKDMLIQAIESRSAAGPA
jgi:AcrR family transcriptional regulator